MPRASKGEKPLLEVASPMPVDPGKIKAEEYYATSLGQVRQVIEVKSRAKRVRYKSRGHKASDRYGQPYEVALEKFARAVERRVWKDYDPDYD